MPKWSRTVKIQGRQGYFFMLNCCPEKKGRRSPVPLVWLAPGKLRAHLRAPSVLRGGGQRSATPEALRFVKAITDHPFIQPEIQGLPLGSQAEVSGAAVGRLWLSPGHPAPLAGLYLSLAS